MDEIKNTMDQPMEESETSTPLGETEVPSTEGEMTPEGVTREYDDATFSVLLALVPLLVFTLFGQIGLF